MKGILLVFFVCFISLCLKFAVAAEHIVAGYLPEYRSYINLNNTVEFLTDVILFSISPNARGGGGILGPCCLEPHHYKQAQEARAYKTEKFPSTYLFVNNSFQYQLQLIEFLVLGACLYSTFSSSISVTYR